MEVVSVAETRGLTMRFGAHTALDGLDVEVGRGVTGVVGANGAGKTTLFSLMLGRLRPSDGALTVLGLDPGRDGSALRAKVGFSPERNVLPDEMPAYDFVRHLAEVRGLPRTEARNRASDALWLMGLGEERFRPLGTMSTGQRQRVKVAQAIAADPSLVLLDEPTDGLDPVQREQMLGLIRTIADEFGIDVLLSSHVLGEVERIADNVVVLDAGHLLAAGSLHGPRRRRHRGGGRDRRGPRRRGRHRTGGLDPARGRTDRRARRRRPARHRRRRAGAHAGCCP